MHTTPKDVCFPVPEWKMLGGLNAVSKLITSRVCLKQGGGCLLALGFCQQPESACGHSLPLLSQLPLGGFEAPENVPKGLSEKPGFVQPVYFQSWPGKRYVCKQGT